MLQRRATTDAEPFVARVALVLLAQCLFVLLVAVATGSPPAFLTTLVFASSLAVGLEAQALRASSDPRARE
jgi:hypothetical protein